MNRSAHHQKGAALFVAMLMLIVMTLLSLASMRSSTLEMRMAGNEETRMAAFEQAQAVVDATIVANANLPGTDEIGYTVCTSNLVVGVATGCSANNLILPAQMAAAVAAGTITARVERTSGQGVDMSPRCTHCANSSRQFTGIGYSVEAVYEPADPRLGQAQIHEGFVKLLNK